ncbi:hypothetical protein ID866_6946 [Astraeus odoratus]|nr:hypothetical protein ID866_6946 [Astraeus odoratus]
MQGCGVRDGLDVVGADAGVTKDNQPDILAPRMDSDETTLVGEEVAYDEKWAGSAAFVMGEVCARSSDAFREFWDALKLGKFKVA